MSNEFEQEYIDEFKKQQQNEQSLQKEKEQQEYNKWLEEKQKKEIEEISKKELNILNNSNLNYESLNEKQKADLHNVAKLMYEQEKDSNFKGTKINVSDAIKILGIENGTITSSTDEVNKVINGEKYINTVFTEYDFDDPEFYMKDKNGNIIYLEDGVTPKKDIEYWNNYNKLLTKFTNGNIKKAGYEIILEKMKGDESLKHLSESELDKYVEEYKKDNGYYDPNVKKNFNGTQIEFDYLTLNELKDINDDTQVLSDNGAQKRTEEKAIQKYNDEKNKLEEDGKYKYLKRDAILSKIEYLSRQDKSWKDIELELKRENDEIGRRKNPNGNDYGDSHYKRFENGELIDRSENGNLINRALITNGYHTMMDGEVVRPKDLYDEETINKINDDIKNRKEYEEYKKQQKEENKENEFVKEIQKWPGEDLDLEHIYFGAPPIFPINEIFNVNVKEPIKGNKSTFEESGNVDLFQKAMFLNSFPILTIRPVDVERPNNQQQVNQVVYKDFAYKFMISNDAEFSYNIHNEYGSSQVENFFQSNLQFDSTRELIQFAKTSNTFAEIMHGIDENFESMFNKVWGEFKKNLGAIGVAYDKAKEATIPGETRLNGVAKKGNITHAIESIGMAALKGILLGNKIDIPDIWKSSSGTPTQTVNIKLHCLHPDNDDLYELQIVTPLKILFKLALPYSTTNVARASNQMSRTFSNIGRDVNDIITYENPPYIKATIDGIFETNIGAITSMNVSGNFKDMSYVKAGRPMLINVELTIRDLYNTIIWDDGDIKDGTGNPREYGPSGARIANNMRDTQRDILSYELKDNSVVMYDAYTHLLPGETGSVREGGKLYAKNAYERKINIDSLKNTRDEAFLSGNKNDILNSNAYTGNNNTEKKPIIYRIQKPCIGNSKVTDDNSIKLLASPDQEITKIDQEYKSIKNADIVDIPYTSTGFSEELKRGIELKFNTKLELIEKYDSQLFTELLFISNEINNNHIQVLDAIQKMKVEAPEIIE